MALDILVVDDDEDMRMTLSDLLSLEGYSVESLASAESLIERMEQDHPTLLLLDLTIPGFDPAEAAAAMKGRGLLDVTTVLALSGLDETRELAKRFGFHGALTKPFALDALLDEAARICGRTSQRSTGVGHELHH